MRAQYESMSTDALLSAHAQLSFLLAINRSVLYQEERRPELHCIESVLESRGVHVA